MPKSVGRANAQSILRGSVTAAHRGAFSPPVAVARIGLCRANIALVVSYMPTRFKRRLSIRGSVITTARFRPPYIWFGCLFYLAILVFGSIPGWRAELGHYAPGFALHSSAYGFLAVVFYYGIITGPWGRFAFALATVAVMGAGDEFVQSFFPYRNADVRDWAVDVAAGLVAALLLVAIEHRQRLASRRF